MKAYGTDNPLLNKPKPLPRVREVKQNGVTLGTKFANMMKTKTRLVSGIYDKGREV